MISQRTAAIIGLICFLCGASLSLSAADRNASLLQSLDSCLMLKERFK